MRSRNLCLAAVAVFGISLAGAARAQVFPLPPPPSLNPTVPAAPSPETPSVGVIGSDATLHQREDRLRDRLTRARADGTLEAAEYQRARHELGDIGRTEARLRLRNHGELTDDETFRLEGRLKALAESVHWAN